MKKLCFTLFAAVGVLSISTVAKAETVYRVSLDGAQASAGAGTGSTATGIGTLVLNLAQDRLTMNLRIEGIDFIANGGADTAANNASVFHIHAGARGVNGDVVFGLIGPNSDSNGDLAITPFLGGANIFSAWDAAEGNGTTLAAQLGALNSEGLYFNLHTGGFPGGEIRGQIVAVPEPSSLVVMTLIGTAIVGTAARRRRKHLPENCV